MGNGISGCVSAGPQLLACVSSGNTEAAREILQHAPAASCYSTYVDRNSPLLSAAGRGHYRLVQAIMEAAVLAHGPSKAKQACINHTNAKGYSALILACMNGHASCVEGLICNGASPLALDNSRHSTALHWAASCCRSDCVQRLLGSGASFTMQSGQVVAIADIPCFDEDNATLVKFVDRHNGWGLSALHLAASKGSTSTVRALLRNGASVAPVTVAPSLPHPHACQPLGSTALHMAAAAEDLPLVRLLLEAQAAQGAPDQRRTVNAAGERPLDVAGSSANLLLLHMLDPSQPLALMPPPQHGLVLYPAAADADGLLDGQAGLLNVVGVAGPGTGAWTVSGRGLGFRSSRRGGRHDQPPHAALGAMLLRLRLVLSLEQVAAQHRLAAAAGGGGAEQQQATSGCKREQQRRRQADEQRQQQLQGKGTRGELAALQARVKSVAALLGVVEEMIAALPASATGRAPPRSSAAAAAAAASGEQLQLTPTRQARGRRRSGGGGSANSGSSGLPTWGLLSGSLSRRSSSSGGSQGGGAAEQAAAAAAGQQEAEEAAAEQVLAAYITPGTLTSLAAVTKLLVSSSSLSSKQRQAAAAGAAAAQQLQQQQQGGDTGAGAAAAAGDQRGRQQGLALMPGEAGRSADGLLTDAAWAEQEHALVLMKGILQTAHASLRAGQQAVSVAASRAALRQRQQDQLQQMLGSDRPLSGAAGRLLLLGHPHAEPSGRGRHSSSRRDSLRALASGGSGGGSLLWGAGSDLAAAGAAAAALDGSLRSSSHHSRRHSEHRSRHGRSSSSGSSRRQRGVSLPLSARAFELPPLQQDAVDQVLSQQQAQQALPQPAARSSAAVSGSWLEERQLRQRQHMLRLQEALARGSGQQRATPALATAPAVAAAAAAPERRPPALAAHSASSSVAGGSSSAAGFASDSGSSGGGAGAGSSSDGGGRRLRAASASSSTAAVSGLSRTFGTDEQSQVSSAGGGRSEAAAGHEHSSPEAGGGDNAAGAAAAAAAAATAGSSPRKLLATTTEDSCSVCSSLDGNTCAICMDSPSSLSVSSCQHALCLQCAYQLCCKSKAAPLCPFCRQPIAGFDQRSLAAGC